jgi:hypothetical protein
MDVTIEYKQETTPPYREETTKTLFGGTKTRQIPQRSITSYNVYLYIVPTEEERATILKYRIAELTFDDEPEFSPRQIDESRQRLLAIGQRHDERVLALAPQHEIDALDNEFEHWERELNHRQEAKIGIRMEEYFDNPFIRKFEHPQDAQSYMDRLRENTLPRIKGYIDEYAQRSDKISFSL